MRKEDLKTVITKSDMTASKIELLFNFFETISSVDSKIIESFSLFFKVLEDQVMHVDYKRFINIIATYLDKITNEEDKYVLQYIQLRCNFVLGEYASAIVLLSNINKKSIPSKDCLIINIIQVTILKALKLEEEFIQVSTEVLQSKYFKTANSFQKGLFYATLTSFMIANHDFNNAKKYYSKTSRFMMLSLEKETYCNDIITFLDLYSKIEFNNIGVLHCDTNELLIQFYDFVTKLNIRKCCPIMNGNIFISIFDSFKGYITKEQEYKICIKILSSLFISDKEFLAVCNYLYEQENEYYLLNETLRDKHMHVLNQYYREVASNMVCNLRDTLRLQFIEEKLSLIEAKYNIDALTECYNRNYLSEVENEKIEDGCVLYFDLDELKLVNDSFGHQNGDTYLKAFGRLLTKLFANDMDKVFRYGGDEFVVIARNSSLNTCIMKVNRLASISAFTKSEVKIKNRMEFSCGICHVQTPMTIKKAMVMADTAMYECKIERKNQGVCLYKIAR